MVEKDTNIRGSCLCNVSSDPLPHNRLQPVVRRQRRVKEKIEEKSHRCRDIKVSGSEIERLALHSREVMVRRDDE